jgi:hypothetical protein
MAVLLIVLVAIVAIVIVAGLALSPMLNKKGDAAIERARELVGGESQVRVIEPKAVGMGTEPAEAGGLLGLGCLCASADKLVFVTWQPRADFVIKRSAITGVETAADDPGAVSKTTIDVHYTRDDGQTALARWRFGRDLVDWLSELGYDWGPDGPPAAATTDADEA